MGEIHVCPQRDEPPCYGCTRKEKTPGCHDHCLDFREWKTVVEHNRQAEREYNAKPFSRIT